MDDPRHSRARHPLLGGVDHLLTDNGVLCVRLLPKPAKDHPFRRSSLNLFAYPRKPCLSAKPNLDILNYHSHVLDINFIPLKFQRYQR